MRRHLRLRITRHLRRGAERAQAMVEMALLMPFLILFGLACMQFVVVFLAYISVVSATRDIARYVSVHPNQTDATSITELQSRLPGNLNSARLTTTLSPACTALVAGKCTARTPGTMVSATLTYSIADILFLPASINVGAFSVSIPQTLPSYSMYIQVEPS